MAEESDFIYFLDLANSEVVQGTAKQGTKVKEILAKHGVSAGQIERNEIAGSIDGVITDLSAQVESRTGSGIVQLAISLKADNG